MKRRRIWRVKSSSGVNYVEKELTICVEANADAVIIRGVDETLDQLDVAVDVCSPPMTFLYSPSLQEITYMIGLVT